MYIQLIIVISAWWHRDQQTWSQSHNLQGQGQKVGLQGQEYDFQGQGQRLDLHGQGWGSAEALSWVFILYLASTGK